MSMDAIVRTAAAGRVRSGRLESGAWRCRWRWRLCPGPGSAIGGGRFEPPLRTASSKIGYRAGAFPNAERLAATSLSLPMYPELGRDEIDRVVAGIRRHYLG